jgi:hypothetical protein
MKSRLSAAVLGAIVLGSGATADVGTAKDRRTSDESLLARSVASSNKVCASAITVTLAPASVRGAGVDPDERAITARRCRDVFDAIRPLCRTAAVRAAVSAQIKQVSCGVNSERPAVALENGKLVYRIELGLATWNDSQMISDYLLDHLAVGGQPLIVEVVRPLEEAALANQIAQMNQQCRTSVVATLDWTGIPVQALKSRAPSNYCGHAIDAVERVCVDHAGRDAVARQVSRIVCGHADKRSISLRSGVLDFRSDLQSSGDRGAVFEYLQNVL